MKYGILKNGDIDEIRYWTDFMEDQFPAYEIYWYHKIVPLTDRPRSVHFLKSEILEGRGIDPEEVCKAQLHYTTFKHLARTFDIILFLKFNCEGCDEVSILGEGFFHISSAQDVAFEFLQRCYNPGSYEAWKPMRKGKGDTKGGKEARQEFYINNSYPLKEIREYRNHLAHGLMVPSIDSTEKRVKVPIIGKELDYMDWRLITDGYKESRVNDNFDFVFNILESAFRKTNAYLNIEWLKYLKSADLE